MSNNIKHKSLAYPVLVKRIYNMNSKFDIVFLDNRTVIVPKDLFKENDYAIYIRTGTIVPKIPVFSFLEKDNYIVKFKKKDDIYSDGLLIHLDEFTDADKHSTCYPCIQGLKFRIKKKDNILYEDLTVPLELRSIDSSNDCENLIGKSKKFFKPKYNFLPNNHIPEGEDVYYELTTLFHNKRFVVTELCGGVKTVYELNRNTFGFKFNIYTEDLTMLEEAKNFAKKYKIKEYLRKYIGDNKELNSVQIAGTICGPKIKNNPHRLTANDFFAFELDTNFGTEYQPATFKSFDEYGIKHPSFFKSYTIPERFEYLKEEVLFDYSHSVCEGQTNIPLKGLVFRCYDCDNYVFKLYNPIFLLEQYSS